MNRLQFPLYTAVLLLVLLAACRKDDSPSETDFAYEYYPTAVGHWVEYDVEEILFDDFDTSKVDTVRYQLREVVAEQFLDGEGREAQRIERFTRANDTTAWSIKNVWFGNTTTTTAERVEENARYIKLVFPPKVDKTWNGNAFNILDEQEYEVTAYDEASSLNGLDFAKTLTVVQVDDSIIIEQKKAVEKYARDVGMIYRQYIFLKTQLVDSGIISTTTIRAFGN